MKKNALLVCFIILGHWTFAQQRVERKYDSLHRLAFVEYSKNNILFREISFYSNGRKKKEANFDTEGKLFGLQIEYFENGHKKSVKFVIGVDPIQYRLLNDSASSEEVVDAITCKSTTYYENGKKNAEGYVINGMRSGFWSFYDEAGKIKSSRFYRCLSKDE